MCGRRPVALPRYSAELECRQERPRWRGPTSKWTRRAAGRSLLATFAFASQTPGACVRRPRAATIRTIPHSSSKFLRGHRRKGFFVDIQGMPCIMSAAFGRLPPHNLQYQLEDGRLTGGRGRNAPAFFSGVDGRGLAFVHPCTRSPSPSMAMGSLSCIPALARPRGSRCPLRGHPLGALRAPAGQGLPPFAHLRCATHSWLWDRGVVKQREIPYCNDQYEHAGQASRTGKRSTPG